MVYITHELTQASGPDVIIFSNCDEVRLTWLGKEIGTMKPDSTKRIMPHAPFIFHNVFNYHEISSHWRNRSNKIEMVAEGLINGKVVCREVKRYAERTTGIRLTIDSLGEGLVADGADFVPVRATIVDNKGIPKVLASEDIRLDVIAGDADIIGGDIITINPMKTQFGTATFLLRAGMKPGAIRIKATSDGLKGSELEIVSTPSRLPLLYTDTASRRSSPIKAPLQLNNPSLTNTDDIEKIKEENNRLRLQLTSKEQEIMEMRSRTNK
jgi:beta-galactosidase